MKRNDDGDLIYDHAEIGTSGSRNVRNNWGFLRNAGATARRMLVEEAAERWNLPPDGLGAKMSFVFDSGGERRISYGELAGKVARRRVDPHKIHFKEESAYHILRRAVQKAWIDIDVPQCGHCQTAQIMAAVALIERNPAPTDADIPPAPACLSRGGGP